MPKRKDKIHKPPNTTKCICTFLNFKIKNCLMFQNCASQISTRPLKAWQTREVTSLIHLQKMGTRCMMKNIKSKPLQKIRISKLNNGRRKKNLPRKISLLLLSLFSNHFWKRCANSDSRFFKYSPTNHITSSVAMTNTNPYYNTNMMVIYTINDGLMKTFLKKRICYIYIICITARNCRNWVV